MSIFPKDTVSSIAETLGISVSDDVAATILQDAEYRLRELIHESARFMRRAHRSKLTANDINLALGVKNQSRIYGYSYDQGSFKSVNVGGSDVFIFVNLQVHYLDDQEVDLEELIHKPLPAIPHDVSFTAHWLAIEGVQPRIVQNPTPHELLVQESKVNNAPIDKDAPKVNEILTKELQLYYEHIVANIMKPDRKTRTLAIESVTSG